MGTGVLGLAIFFCILLWLALKWQHIGNGEATGLGLAWIAALAACRLLGWELLVPLGSATVLLNAWLLYRLEWLGLHYRR